jgi:ribosomal protein L11 methyltransferase
MSDAVFLTLRVRAADRALAERAAAEAYEAGALGLEECNGEGTLIELYLPAEAEEAVTRALAPLGVELAAPGRVDDTDWSEAWKESLEPIVISPRLVVRPSFREVAPVAGQHVVVVDPGQAFGTGAHESTRLALEWIDLLAPELAPGACMLDVGTGTGVLALAALGLSPAVAVGFDLDPLAPEAARANARDNGAAQRLRCFTGGIEAIQPEARFALVVANMLRRETEPVFEAIAAHTEPGGAVVLSGLLATERARMEALGTEYGLQPAGARALVDASGETWVGLLMRRAPDRATNRTAARA